MKAFQYKNLSTAATTVVKANTGVLHSVTINTKGASSCTITLYDNATAASGTVIATIDGTAAIGTFIFDAMFLNGLTVIIQTGTPADITVNFL